MLGDNLPPPSEVISLLNSKNITKTRLFNPNQEALQALQNSGVEVILGTLNQDIQTLATNPSFALNWLQTNVIPFAETVKFRCISVGNEVIPSNLAPFVFPAMQTLKAALLESNLEINVTTCFLVENQSPLLVNIYPYFAYIYEQQEIALAYALFNSSEVVVRDGDFEYYNLFDAMIDAVYSALEKIGGESVEILVSESGWPSNENGEIATIENAKMYNNNLIRHVLRGNGTPKRKGKSIEGFVFAIFNENLKPPGTEQNFGLFYPNMTEVYHVAFHPY
ncbi:hypothetical protein UlMin_001168 [Ulmus minor]